MSRDGVETMRKADEESWTTVWSWLLDAGIPSGNITDKGDWLQVTTLVQTVEAMRNNTFFWTFCINIITPKCLKPIYNVHYQAKINDRTVIGVASSLNESARYSDLALFEENLTPGALGQNMTVVSINGAPNDQSPGSSTEANLDIQYVIGMANGVHVTEFITSGLAAPFDDFSIIWRRRTDGAKIVSPRTCFMIAQLGTRGTSVMVASGDNGVGTASACPWVTSVGGVCHIDPEQAVYLSSGYFFDLWPRPSYQQVAVEDFLQTQLGDRQKGLFDPHGRAFPDVSAQSLCGPNFAGIIGLLNAARISSQFPPFGFLNPWLYSVGKKSLRDILHGGSTGCNGHFRFEGSLNGRQIVPYASWNATPDWNPVTGLGTPDFGNLLELSTPGFRIREEGFDDDLEHVYHKMYMVRQFVG
ncbi:hypothetical protein EAF00_011279 [Botryotinia globosa]|nr:hypothetical protein EAF00_011279 [Botryotinia globosa]